MPATCKAGLLAVTHAEYARLRAAIDPLSEPQALCPRAGGLSVKDIVAHRAHWLALFLGWYAEGQAGRAVHTPAPGYNWAQLDAYNATVRAAWAGKGWAEVCQALAQGHAALVALIERLDDAALYGAPMKGPASPWTTGRWAEANGASHYRSAVKWLRPALRQ